MSYINLFLLLFVTVVLPRHAWSDDHRRLKREVLANCSAAHSSFDLLPPETRPVLVLYLGRVLELQLGRVHSIPPPLTDPSIGTSLPVTDPRVSDSLVITDPASELAAKKCAIELLQKIGAPAFTALPALFQLILKPTTPYSLKYEAVQLVRAVAHAFANANQPLDSEHRKVITTLIEALGSEYSFVAETALIELKERSLSLLVEHISKEGNLTNLDLRSLLLSYKSLGISVPPHLYPLLSGAEEPLKIDILHLLVTLEPSLPEALPALIRLLDDISAHTRQETRKAISEIVFTDTNRRFSLESTIQDALITNFRIAPASERIEMKRWLPILLDCVDDLLPRFLALSQGAPRELKRDLLEIISRSSITKSPDKAFAIVTQSLKDSSLEIRTMAIQALGAFPQKDIPATKVLTQVFKTLPPTRDLTERNMLLEAAIHAASRLPAAQSQTLIPFLIQSLETQLGPEKETAYRSFPRLRGPASLQSIHAAHPAIEVLVAFGENVRTALEKVAKQGNSDQARRAIAVLGKLRPQYSSVALLAKLLEVKHQSTIIEAARALLQLGPSIIAPLRKVFPTLSVNAKLHASEIIIMLGDRTLADSKRLFASLDKSDCETRAERILLIHDFSHEERQQITSATVSCLGMNHELDRKTLEALARLTPLNETTQRALLANLKSPTSSPQLKLALLENAEPLGFPTELITPVFYEIIRSAHGSLQLQSIRSLRKFTAADQPLIELLREIIADNPHETKRSFAIAGVLSSIPEANFKLDDWLLESFNESTFELTQKLIKTLPAKHIEEIITLMLSNGNERDHLLTLRLASRVLLPECRILPGLEPFLASRDSTLQFEAFKAALACKTLSPTVERAFAELIYSSQTRQLFQLTLPESLLPFLEKLIEQTSYDSERSVLLRLRTNSTIAATNNIAQEKDSVLKHSPAI